MAEGSLSLVNVFEIEEDGQKRHFIGYVDPVLAGSRGIAARAILGEFTPDAGGQFDPETFLLNPEFIEALTAYMNGPPSRSAGVSAGARESAGKPLYVVDPRNTSDSDGDPPEEDILGWYDVDADGVIVPDSFQYHVNHAWFSAEHGLSGMLSDRGFYAWLNPDAAQTG